MDINYIKTITADVLNSNFKESQKRMIRDYPDRINFACPYCGDSHNVHKKRGNIYFDRLFYVCFNCDRKTTFDKFAKDFNKVLDPDKKMEIIEHLNNNLTYNDFQDDFIDTKFDDLIDMKSLEDACNVRKVSPIYDFEPIKKNGGIYKYLTGRGIPEELHENIYQAKFSKGDEGFEHVIVLLNRRGEKVLGIQVRNLRMGKRRFFTIYNYETLCEWVGKSIDDESKMVVYNKLSYFFNILNVDMSREITLFEGYLDSLFFPNSIGVIGVNTDLRFLESNDLLLRYFYDNDRAGFKKSLQKLNSGYPVFLWMKLFDDITEKKNSQDPFSLYQRISKVKDLNKLAEFVKDPYKKLDLDSYFSKDIFDKRFIPKLKYVKRDDNKDYQKRFGQEL